MHLIFFNFYRERNRNFLPENVFSNKNYSLDFTLTIFFKLLPIKLTFIRTRIDIFIEDTRACEKNLHEKSIRKKVTR